MIERETRTPRSRYIITIHFYSYLLAERCGNRAEKRRLLYILGLPSSTLFLSFISHRRYCAVPMRFSF